MATSTPETRMKTVAEQFMKHYYMCLNSRPDTLASLYAGENSYMSRGEEGKPVKVYRGDKVIGQVLLQTFKDANARTEISLFDSQPGHVENSIVIQVIGFLSERNEDARKFCQTFFLLGNSINNRVCYAIVNDIFRFLHEDDEDSYDLELIQGGAEAAPAAAKTAAPAKAAEGAAVAAPAPAPKVAEAAPKAPSTASVPAPVAPAPSKVESAAPVAEVAKPAAPKPATAQPQAAKPTPAPVAAPAPAPVASAPVSYAARLKKSAAPVVAPAPATLPPPPAAAQQPAAQTAAAPGPAAETPGSDASAASNDVAAASAAAGGDEDGKADGAGEGRGGSRRGAPAAAAGGATAGGDLASRGDVMPNSVFIGSVPPETTEADLMQVFSVAGTIVESYMDGSKECKGIEIIKSQKAASTSKPNTFAFVTFTTSEAARRAIEGDLKGTFMLQDQVLNVRERQKRADTREVKPGSRGGRGGRGGRSRGGAVRTGRGGRGGAGAESSNRSTATA